MTDKIKYSKTKKVKYFIDGIEIPVPKTFDEHLGVGVWTLFLIITSPIWVIPWLVGKTVKALAREKVTEEMDCVFYCPKCDNPIKEINGFQRVECEKCRWYGYLDHIEKQEEVKR